MKSNELPPPINIYYIFLTRRLNTSCVITRSSRHRKKGRTLDIPETKPYLRKAKKTYPNSL